MDEIGQEPRWDFRLPPRHWLVVLAAGVLIAAAAALAGTLGGGRTAAGGHPPTVPASAPAVLSTSSPSPSPTGAPGTVLFTCDAAASYGLGGSPSSTGSLRAGPLWFVGGGRLGYVHEGRPGTRRVSPRPGKLHLVVMIVAVSSGPPVVLKPAAAALPYFHFVAGFGPGVGYPLPAGDTGFTFIPCPRPAPGPNGDVTDFYLGFSIAAGRSAPAEVLRSASRPVWVTFTSPGRGGPG